MPPKAATGSGGMSPQKKFGCSEVSFGSFSVLDRFGSRTEWLPGSELDRHLSIVACMLKHWTNQL